MQNLLASLLNRAGRARCGEVDRAAYWDRRAGFEMLESRCLMSAVSWTGAAGDNLWHTPSNWSGNAVPTINDDVTINLAATDPVISLTATSGDRSVRSLSTSEALSFQGGSLTVATNAAFSKNITLAGGTLIGGTYTGSGGATFVITSTGSFLKDLAFNGELLLNAASARLTVLGSTSFAAARLMASNALLRMAPGYVLSAPIFAEGAATGNRLITVAADAPGIVTIAPTGSIQLKPGTGGGLTIQQSQTGTLVNNGLISAEAAERTFSIQISSFVNAGTLQALAGTINLGTTITTSWSNDAAGTIILDGVTATFGSTWTNAGNVSVTGSTLNLDGVMTTPGLGLSGFQAFGSTVNLRGSLANANATLALNASTGSWRLLGGKIFGGTLTTADGFALITTSTEGQLRDVAIMDDLVVASGAKLLVAGETTFSKARMGGGGAVLALAVGYVLRAEVINETGATGQSTITVRSLGTPGDATISPSGSLHVAGAPSFELKVSVDFGCRLVSQGVWNIETGSVTTSGGSLRMEGLFKLGVGVSATLAGSVDATSPLADWQTGPGVLRITGVFDMTGRTLILDASKGSWILAGTLQGGVVLPEGDRSLIFEAPSSLVTITLIDVDYREVVTVTDNQSFKLGGATRFMGLHLTGQSAFVKFSPGFVLGMPLIADGSSSGTRRMQIEGSFFIGPTGSVRQAADAGAPLSIESSGVGVIWNAGVIEQLSAAQPFSVVVQASSGSPAVRNSGLIRATAGSLTLNTGLENHAGQVFSAPGASIVIQSELDATQGIGTLASNGGTIEVQAGVVNTFSVITFNSTTCSWTLKGQIRGGAVDFDGVARVLPTSGSFSLSDVEIVGDVVLDTPSAVATIRGSTTFASLKLAAADTKVILGDGVVISGEIVAVGSGATARLIELEQSGPTIARVDAGGAIRIDSEADVDLRISGLPNATLIINGLLESASPGTTLFVETIGFRNAGIVRAFGGGLSINTQTWSNTASGVMEGSGGVLTFGGNWTNSGVVSLFNSTIYLGGSGTVASVLFSGQNSVLIQGDVSLGGGVLSWGPSSGALKIDGGTLRNGTVLLLSGATLGATTKSGSLVDVTVAGEIVLDVAGASLRVQGLTSFAAARLKGQVALVCADGYQLSSPVLAEGASPGVRSLVIEGQLTATSQIVLAADCGDNLQILTQSGVGAITNQGSISAEAPGRLLSLSARTTNSGQIIAVGGSLTSFGLTNTSGGVVSGTDCTLALSELVNAGKVTITNSSLTLGGNIAISSLTEGRLVRSGGTVQIAGVLSGGTLDLNATTGGMVLAGGTIKDATVRSFDGAWLGFTGGTLQNVTLEGEIVLDGANQRIRLIGTTTFTAARLRASGAGLSMNANFVLNSPVFVEGSALGDRVITLIGVVGSTNLVTIGPAGSIRVLAGSGGGLALDTQGGVSLVNNGVLSSASAGKTFAIRPRNFTNNGTAEADGGAILIQTTSSWTNIQGPILAGGTWRVVHGGSISSVYVGVRVINAVVELGSGGVWNLLEKADSIAATGSLTLSGGITFTTSPVSGLFTNSGVLALDSASSFVVNGGFSQVAGAALRIAVAGTGPGQFGAVRASGAASLGGSIEVTTVNDYHPQRFDMQDLLTSTGLTTGAFSTVKLPTPDNPDWKCVLISNSHGISLLTTSIIDFNNDGLVDLDDFFGFFDRWDRFDASLDLNGDGAVDLGDYFVFFNLWAGS